jgi:predicted HTH transcriptional regulator
MYQAGYIERFGTGVSEMIQLSVEDVLKEPESDFSGGAAITLWRPVKHIETARSQQETRALILTSLKSNPAI